MITYLDGTDHSFNFYQENSRSGSSMECILIFSDNFFNLTSCIDPKERRKKRRRKKKREQMNDCFIELGHTAVSNWGGSV